MPQPYEQWINNIVAPTAPVAPQLPVAPVATPGPTAELLPMIMGGGGGGGTVIPEASWYPPYTPGQRAPGAGYIQEAPVMPPSALTQRIAELRTTFPGPTAGISDQILGGMITAHNTTQFNATYGLGGTPMTAWQQAQYGLSLDASQAAAESAQNTLAYNWAQLAQQGAYQQAQMQQAGELAALARAQQQRQMAAQIGQTIAQLQSQQWQTGLPWELPRGTMYTPGHEPGGPAERMAGVGQFQFTPRWAQTSRGPSRKEMEKWLSSAISRFGP